MCFAPQRRALFRHRNFQKWSDHGVFCTFWLQNVLRATTACTFSTSQLPKVVRSSSVLSILTWKCASRHNGVHFFMSHLASWLRTRRFSEPTFRPSGATNHWKNTVNRDFPIFSRIYLFFLLIFSLLTLFTSAFQLSILSEVSLLNFLRLIYIWWPQYPRSRLSPVATNLPHGGMRSAQCDQALRHQQQVRLESPWENPWENHGTTTTVELSEKKTSIVHRYVQEGHSCKYHTHDLRGFRTGIKMFPRFSRSIYPRFIHASISNVRSFYHSIVLSCFIGIPSSWMIIPNRGANITAYNQSTRLLNKQNLTHPY